MSGGWRAVGDCERNDPPPTTENPLPPLQKHPGERRLPLADPIDHPFGRARAGVRARGHEMLAGERQPEAPAARLAPVAHERTDRVHRALVELRHRVQVEAERADTLWDVAAYGAQPECVRAGDGAREVERGRAVTDFERVL